MSSKSERKRVSLQKLKEVAPEKVQITCNYHLLDDEFGFFKAYVNWKKDKVISGVYECDLIFDGDEERVKQVIKDKYNGIVRNVYLEKKLIWKKNKL